MESFVLNGMNRHFNSNISDLSAFWQVSPRSRRILMQRLESAQNKIQNFTLSQAKLEAELSVRNEMIERLMAENRRMHDAPAN